MSKNRRYPVAMTKNSGEPPGVKEEKSMSKSNEEEGLTIFPS